jgi:hypothetical protein
MNLKPISGRLRRTVAAPDRALLIELVSGALLLVWVARWVAE